MSERMLSYTTSESDGWAFLHVGNQTLKFKGNWVQGSPWERFGLYNHYVVLREDGCAAKIKAHAGDLVPGSTEDLIASIQRFDPANGFPTAPLCIELDPTFQCYSIDCGGHCFSAEYRALNPRGEIPADVIKEIIVTFAESGGRVVRFDGGGDPLAHAGIRSGALPEFANSYGLKTTILTSGDALLRTNVQRLGEANCYLRVSLNAATNRTRQIFHGNKIELTKLLDRIRQFAQWRDINNPGLPIGATYLLSHLNYNEVYECAVLARDNGLNHFSVRRVLGPAALRPDSQQIDEERLQELLEQTRRLMSRSFRVFIPWRHIEEPDLSPAKDDFVATRCWQSTFKAVIEPASEAAYQVQLCGRYRGAGVGQLMQLPPLFSHTLDTNWLDKWRASFTDYGISRAELPRKCISCIDRGFIKMIDELLTFIGDPLKHFDIIHLNQHND
jgi:MoaA/NifB/PqqE/SkfB family radical SAM enzyme